MYVRAKASQLQKISVTPANIFAVFLQEIQVPGLYPSLFSYLPLGGIDRFRRNLPIGRNSRASDGKAISVVERSRNARQQPNVKTFSAVLFFKFIYLFGFMLSVASPAIGRWGVQGQRPGGGLWAKPPEAEAICYLKRHKTFIYLHILRFLVCIHNTDQAQFSPLIITPPPSNFSPDLHESENRV